MGRKEFIALADMIRAHNAHCSLGDMFSEVHITALAGFCHEQNSEFKCERWESYIAGKVGPKGGRLRRKA